MIISKKKLKELLDKAYSDGFADGANNADADVISSVKWVEDDIRNAYAKKLMQNPTDDEVKEIIDSCDWKGLEEASIESGWNFINNAIDDVLMYDKDE